MKALKSILIFLLSGITAVIILNFILLFYYNLPLHLSNLDKSTDYIWESKGKWIKMSEGISWGKMDAAGFNNKSVIENPDVLILGSSHMEATNVFQKYNTANQLQELLENSNLSFRVYNKGISGHHFLKCCKYLGINSKSTTAKYIVIETSKLDYNTSDIQNLFDNKIEYTASHTSGIIYYLQKLPLFRLTSFQLEHGLIDLFLPKKTKSSNMKDSSSIQPQESENQIQENYDKLFSYISTNANGKQVVIFYHTTGTPMENGGLEYSTPVLHLNEFKEAAEKYGIGFIDLTEETEKLWQTEHKTTHGFTTGTAFSGHLNRKGHEIAARKLADYIIQNEEITNVAF